MPEGKGARGCRGRDCCRMPEGWQMFFKDELMTATVAMNMNTVAATMWKSRKSEVTGSRGRKREPWCGVAV